MKREKPIKLVAFVVALHRSRSVPRGTLTVAKTKYTLQTIHYTVWSYTVHSAHCTQHTYINTVNHHHHSAERHNRCYLNSINLLNICCVYFFPYFSLMECAPFHAIYGLLMMMIQHFVKLNWIQLQSFLLLSKKITKTNFKDQMKAYKMHFIISIVFCFPLIT